MKGLKLPTTATLEKERLLIQQAKKSKLTDLGDSIRQARYNLNQLKDTTQRVFDTNYKTLSGKLQDASEKGVVDFQENLPKFYDSVHQTYGNTLDEIGTTLEKTRQGIKQEEVIDILKNTLEEADNEFLNTGRAYNRIRQLANKYGLSEAEEVPIEILSSSGKMITKTPKQVEKVFTLQEVKADIDSVFKLVKYGKYGTSEDIPAHILRKNWGKFATDNIEGYGELQNKYSQVVDAMKLSDKLFKPKKGELYTKPGASFLKRFGMVEKPAEAESRLVSMLEEGTEMGEGVGPITQRVKQVGSEMRQLKDANKIMKDNISQRLDRLNIKSSQVRTSLQREFDSKIDNLTLNLADRKKAVALARMLGLTVAGLAGAYGAGRAVANVAGFRESYGQ